MEHHAGDFLRGLNRPTRAENGNLACRDRRAPWLPLWGSWLPHKGQPERAAWFFSSAIILLRYPLSQPVRLTALPKGEPRGATVSARQVTISRSNIARRQTTFPAEKTVANPGFIFYNRMDVICFKERKENLRQHNLQNRTLTFRKTKCE